MSTLMALMPYLVGPAGAVAALAATLWAIYRFVDVQLWPALESWVERHMSQIDRMIQQHASDMHAVQASLGDLASRIEVLAREVDDLRDALP